MNTIEDYIQNIVFVFNSNFEYNEDNFNKIKLLNDIILENIKQILILYLKYIIMIGIIHMFLIIL